MVSVGVSTNHVGERRPRRPDPSTAFVPLHGL